MTMLSRPCKSGTSPRMRGKLITIIVVVVIPGNIPAYAGKTIVLRLGRRPAPEHPRVCGENDEAFKLANADGGTSPRMRGKLRQYFLRHRGLRNIPAYAGKTGQLGGMAGANLEHPRVCGENRQARARPDTPRRNIPAYAGKTKVQDAEAKLQSGTSPRMRRKPADDFHRLSSGKEHPRVCGENTPANEHGFDPRRNIPAYAGKTATHQLSESAETEHPRVCGENQCGIGGLLSGFRNIPAYAGKTASPPTPQRSLPEHPRVCGENPHLSPLMIPKHGTSPRMRGKLGKCQGTGCSMRNIPAYAGKTLFVTVKNVLREEHPRVCGENLAQQREATG